MRNRVRMYSSGAAGGERRNDIGDSFTLGGIQGDG
jgi:hypothetical protein